MTYQVVRSTAAAVCGALLLAACTDTAMTAGGSQDLATRLAGTTVSNDGTTITYGADGSITGTRPSGEPVVGTFTIENGLYCPTITEPPLGERGCSEVTFGEDAITFQRVGSDTPQTWAIES